jgi:hypothetical protein
MVAARRQETATPQYTIELPITNRDSQLHPLLAPHIPSNFPPKQFEFCPHRCTNTYLQNKRMLMIRRFDFGRLSRFRNHKAKYSRSRFRTLQKRLVFTEKCTNYYSLLADNRIRA